MSSYDVRDDQLPAGAGEAAEVTAVPAASVLLLRETPPEVLMIQRHERSSFVPSVWVFPGGVVEPLDGHLAREVGDGSVLDIMRVAGARETLEETGIWLGGLLPAEMRQQLLRSEITLRDVLALAPLDLEQLVWTSRWITPVGIPKRFDTYFFLAPSPEGALAAAELTEAVEVKWIRPEQALLDHRNGGFPMVFPTIRNLEAITGFETCDSLLASRRNVEVPTIQPILVLEDGRKKIVLP